MKPFEVNAETLCPFCGEITTYLQMHLSDGALAAPLRAAAFGFGCERVSRWWATDAEVLFLRSCCVPVIDQQSHHGLSDNEKRKLRFFPRWLRICLESLVPEQRESANSTDQDWSLQDYGSSMRAVVEEVGPDYDLQRSILATFALGKHEAVRKLYKPTPIFVFRESNTGLKAKFCIGSV